MPSDLYKFAFVARAKEFFANADIAALNEVAEKALIELFADLGRSP